MKYNKRLNPTSFVSYIILIVIFLIIFAIPYTFYYRIQLTKFYQEIQYVYGEIAELEWGEIHIHPDTFCIDSIKVIFYFQ